MTRTEIINHYISKKEYKDYLEIGTQRNVNFSQISINKTSVDPDPKAEADFQMTSDKFFYQVSKEVMWDIVFVDGLHHKEQMYKDVLNSLDHLKEGGTIICHDCNPIKEIEQRVPMETGRWNGDVWKAIVKLRSERDDLNIFTIDADEGCAVIQRSNNKVKLLDIEDKELTYDNLIQYREEWLNLISVDEWLKTLE